jgi:hypothetical protein
MDMDVKVRLLLMTVRSTMTELIAALEDFLGIEYADSILYKRRARKENR